jgi:hypothetical protein
MIPLSHKTKIYQKMKRNILLLTLIAGAGIAFFTGCSKDDTASPNITLAGSTSVEVSLGSGTWTDPGATANDDEDGTTTVTSDYSSTNPNTNLVGTYTITYTSTDKAGNTGTAIRTVRVKNDAEDFAGNYQVSDTVPGTLFTYPQIITVDSSVNNRVHFNRFGDYDNNPNIYATKLGNGHLEIPSQTAVNIGSGTGCNVATHQFSSTSYTDITNGFILHYNDAKTAPASCISSTDGVATYIKQ